MNNIIKNVEITKTNLKVAANSVLKADIFVFAFVKLLLSSESLLLLVDKVTYIKAHNKNTRPMPSVNK